MLEKVSQKFFPNHRFTFSSSNRTVCMCNTDEACNSPKSPLAAFEFVETELLEGYDLYGGKGGGDAEKKEKEVVSFRSHSSLFPESNT